MKQKDADLEKKTLNLFQGDFDRMGVYYKLGASIGIRMVIRAHLAKLDAQASQAQAPMEELA